MLYGARQLLTLRGPSEARRGSDLHELAIVENGSVLIENGVVHSLGSTRRIENLKEAKDALTIDVSGGIVMPGLIDPDVTLTYGGSAHGRSRRAPRIYEDGLALMRSCLQQGTVAAVLNASAETKSFASDVALLRQIQKIGRNPVDTVRAWQIARMPEDAAELSALGQALDIAAKRRLVECFCISSDVACDQNFGACLNRILGTRVPSVLRWNGGRGPTLEDILSQMRPRAVSCSSLLSSDEVGALAGSSAIAVFAPGSEMGRSSGSGLRRLADAGGAIALSSGYHPVRTPGFSMQMAISLATIHGGLSAEEAIVAATVNAAYAAGCGHATGTIEKGRRANLLILNVPDYREIPRQFGINRVSTVLKDGDVVLNRAGWKMVSNAAAGRMRSQHLRGA